MTAHRPVRARGRALLVVPVLALAVVVGGVATPMTAAAAAGDDAPDPVIFILDASGSMVREVTPGVSRMEVARDALTDTIETLPRGTETGVLVFGTGTGNDDSERAAGCSDVRELVGVGPVDAGEAATAIAGVQASGFTPIGPALRAAVELLPDDTAGSIVLVSDGVDTCAPPSSCEVAAELHRDHPDISIHVVAFGVDGDEAAEQQMTCIGGVGGGTSVSASDPDQLIAQLRAASDSTALAESLSAAGSHGVGLGMTLAEVRAAVDGARVGEARTIDDVVVVEVDCGWGTVELRDGRVYSIRLADDDRGTAEGLAPGGDLADFEALYGPAVASGTDDDGPFAVFGAREGTPIGYRVGLAADGTTVRVVVVCRCAPVSTSARFWEVSTEGVGPLQLGMSSAEARAALPSLVELSGAPLVLVMNGSDGGEVLRAEFAGDTLIRVRVASAYDDPLVDGPYLPNARGIRIGDTMATAIDAFPGGSFDTVKLMGSSTYTVMDRTGRLIVFEGEGSTLFADDMIAEIAASPIRSMTVDDAAVSRTDATLDQLYPGRVSAVESADGVAPDELAGQWCTRDGGAAHAGSDDACFSFADLASRFPDVAVPSDVLSGGRSDVSPFAVCLEYDLDGTDCSTAATMYFDYFPAGVGWECDPGEVWSGCEPDYTADHDTSQPRLVIRPNHQQDDYFIDSPPLYRR